MDLNTPVEKILKISPLYQKKLKRLGIKTVKDLFYYFPFRYEDFSKIIPISQIKLNETCCIRGKILEIKKTKTWKKKMVLVQAIVGDRSGMAMAVWFNQPYLLNILKRGDEVCLAGKVSLGPEGIYLNNPSYEKILKEDKELIHTGRLVSIYPETEGVSSRWLRYIIRSLYWKFKNKIPEILPKEIIEENHFPEREEAIFEIHFPKNKNSLEKARERFSFEELFLIQLSVLKEKLKLAKEKALSIPMDVNLIKKFVSLLPFKLTNAQRKCAFQILKDLEKNRPMNRLLEGDVGSGKTIVAMIASLNVVKKGYQVALMTPTEILAKQHFKEFSKYLFPFKIKIALLTSKEDKVASTKLKNETMEISRNKLIEKTEKGEIGILIGTHALIQDKVKFKNLALVIVDEQHRFGVEQRAKLLQNAQAREGSEISFKNNTNYPRYIPHFLSMTATPIPRSLALTIYGDLDLSLLDEMPKGRKKVITKIVEPEDREKIYEFIRKEVKKDRRVFVICPRIETKENEIDEGFIEKEGFSDLTEIKAVKKEYQKLSKEIFPDLKVGMLYGKMKPKEKEKIMKNFRDGKIDILVSTSVVEVGIDVPKATIMLIEGAERFGLAQLHQFRGRVGRSHYQSYCFLFTDSLSQKTKERLMAFVKCENGFELAEKDLKLRGPGSLYGTKQWGIPDLAMEKIMDVQLVEKTRRWARWLLEKDPYLKNYPLLKENLKEFGKRLHLE
jgi:ATP-dependent DNA helicase RecG